MDTFSLVLSNHSILAGSTGHTSDGMYYDLDFSTKTRGVVVGANIINHGNPTPSFLGVITHISGV